jgi:hypothetical protein
MRTFAQHELAHPLTALHKLPDAHGHTRSDDEEEEEEEEQAMPTLHVYPVEGGGFLVTNDALDAEVPPIAEHSAPARTTRSQAPHEPSVLPSFVAVLLLLGLFLLLDSLDSTWLTLLTPTALVTIVPKQQAITTTASFPLGRGPKTVAGRVLPTLTLSQSQTVAATGHGHQDARAAVGVLTWYNGSFVSQTVEAGTVVTANDGMAVVTEETVTIPANQPPTDGVAQVTAHALTAGQRGNIPPLAITATVSTTLSVQNLTAFTGGQDARNVRLVTQSDIEQALGMLMPSLVQSGQSAFTAHLTPGEALVAPTCTPMVSTDHRPGEEATSVQVTVTETCRAVVYQPHALQQAAWQLVQAHRPPTWHTPAHLQGTLQVAVRSATFTARPDSVATLTASIQGIWVATLNEGQMQHLIADQPRLEALRLLGRLPGVRRVTIAGLGDTGRVPADLSRIHLLMLVEKDSLCQAFLGAIWSEEKNQCK